MTNAIAEVFQGVWHIIQGFIRAIFGFVETTAHMVERVLVDTLKLSRDTAKFLINNLAILLVFIAGFVIYSAISQQKGSPVARAKASTKKNL
ncbi:hypothetical protein OIO90_004081 [Microbotryomycetes sp. JL221]|nr:hypothetical protein OIO90_004081 [Microbotryomycetes sp. JL221]